ncbi:hypothetical protein QI633_09600 [Nocardioides sp. QY071]|uniref:hypothetical protein n=1 Tax=Nocardioides sp. QY071 TaxID=3044187 RepID=UPI00249C5A79|nr:hypothetical protein [Nocardioides sp. QY071]WGY04007.1 hypothetical protein QI633_09600 [Nocardioides sp. QY071]
MPKKDSKSTKPRKTAAEESKARRTRKQRTTDPMQKATKAGRQRAGGAESDEGSASPTDRPQCSGTKPNGERCRRSPVRGGDRCQKHGGVAERTNAQKRADLNAAVNGSEKVTCTARKRNGDRCSNPPVTGTMVCRMHGAGAPQVKAKANQRLIEMVLPAMRELRRILDSKTASDADKLKAVNMVLQRTGYNERHSIDIGLRERNPWDLLTGGDSPAFSILRGRENVIDPADDTAALPGGGVGEAEDEALTAFLDRRERDREREASTRLDNSRHDVVPGDVVEEDRDAGLFGYPRSRAARLAESGQPSEYDPEPHRDPDRDPWSDYEDELRRRLRE